MKLDPLIVKNVLYFIIVNGVLCTFVPLLDASNDYKLYQDWVFYLSVLVSPAAAFNIFHKYYPNAKAFASMLFGYCAVYTVIDFALRLFTEVERASVINIVSAFIVAVCNYLWRLAERPRE